MISNCYHFASLLLNLCTRRNLLGTEETAKETADSDRLMKNPMLTAIPRLPEWHLPLSHVQMEAELVCRSPCAPLVSDWLDFVIEDLQTSCVAAKQFSTVPQDVLARRLSYFYADFQQRSQPWRLTSPDLRSWTNPTKFDQRNAGSVWLQDTPVTHVSPAEF